MNLNNKPLKDKIKTTCGKATQEDMYDEKIIDIIELQMEMEI